MAEKGLEFERMLIRGVQEAFEFNHTNAEAIIIWHTKRMQKKIKKLSEGRNAQGEWLN